MNTNASATTTDIQRGWGWFMALGILMIVGGMAALVTPFLFSIFVETGVGIFLIIGGVAMIIQVFSIKDDWSGRISYLMLGGFNLIVGVLLFMRPLEGVLVVTMVLIVGFFVGGLFRIAVGIMARPEAGSGWVILGGCLTVLASGYLAMNYPEISGVLLGTVAAVSLIGEGASYICFAYGLKSANS